jgi:LmbE family N-acetylglucosaminyl deacetylase
LFYTKNVIDDGHLSLLNGNNIENLYYYDNYQGFKELLFSVKKKNISSCEDSALNLVLGTKKAVFYVPHQDDETLYYGQTITAAVDVLGKENVYVVLLTDGNSSNAKNNEFIKNGLNNYNSVNEKKLSFSGARDNEYRRALIEMGVENIHVIETFGNNRFNDGAFTKGTKIYNNNLVALKNLIVSYSSKLDDVTHFAFTNLDDNDDHEVLGTVLTSLYYDKNVSGFENVYLIVKSTEMVGHNRHVIPDNTAKKYTREDSILDKYSVVLDYSEGFERIRKAFTKFGYYENGECVSDGDLLGIGCISDKALFERINARLDKNAELPLDTVIHIPFKK